MSSTVDSGMQQDRKGQMLNRRSFLGMGAAVAAACTTHGMAAAAMAPAVTVKPGKKSTVSPIPGKAMPLSLSAITTEGARTTTSIENLKSFTDFLKLAKDLGFDGIHMRASLGGLQTPIGELYARAALIKKSGLKVSSVVPDFDVPINNAKAADCLRNMKPYLNFAEIFECDMIRVGMKSEADIPWAQRAADEAAERKLFLTHHNEGNTMFETFDLTMKTLKAINRPNFGIIYDEAQIIANTPDYDESRIVEQIKHMGPWIWEVFCKNNNGGNGQKGGRPETQLTASGGVNYPKVFEGLYAIGYKGWLTTHNKRDAYGDDADLAARKAYEFLTKYAEHERKA